MASRGAPKRAPTFNVLGPPRAFRCSEGVVPIQRSSSVRDSLELSPPSQEQPDQRSDELSSDRLAAAASFRIAIGLTMFEKPP